MSQRSSRAVIALTGAALFMIVLDNLIVLSTLPSIQRSLHTSLSSLEWVVNAYILSFAVLMLTGAALGERFGRRRVFTGGLLIFSLASAAAALAPSAGALIVARVVQGAGGAILMPLTLTLLSAAFPPERRAAALGIWSGISGVGVALGPIAGGTIASALSWHWIFWINVPIGFVAAWWAPRLLEESRGRPERIDATGLVLASAALLALVWTTVRGNDVGWTAAPTVIGYAVGAVGLAAFLRWEVGSEHPMLPLRLFSSGAFSASNAAGFLLHFAMFGAFFLLVQFLSDVRGEGPISAGVAMLPWTLMPLIVAPLAGRAVRRRDPFALTASGLALAAAGIVAIAVVVGPGTTPLALAPALLAIGVGIGLVLPSIASSAIGAVPALDIGKASGTLSTARQVGSVFGVAVAVAVFQAAASGSSPASLSDGVAAGLFVAAAAAAAGAMVSALALYAPRSRAAASTSPAGATTA